MSKAHTNSNRFPQQYWSIVEIVGEQEQTLELPFDTKQSAHNFRQRFYSFRKAALRELPKVVDGLENPKIFALDALYLTIEPNGDRFNVVIAHRSTSPDGLIINEAIEKLKKGEEQAGERGGPHAD